MQIPDWRLLRRGWCCQTSLRWIRLTPELEYKGFSLLGRIGRIGLVARDER